MLAEWRHSTVELAQWVVMISSEKYSGITISQLLADEHPGGIVSRKYCGKLLSWIFYKVVLSYCFRCVTLVVILYTKHPGHNSAHG
jgi:hypothetical protein